MIDPTTGEPVEVRCPVCGAVDYACSTWDDPERNLTPRSENLEPDAESPAGASPFAPTVEDVGDQAAPG